MAIAASGIQSLRASRRPAGRPGQPAILGALLLLLAPPASARTGTPPASFGSALPALQIGDAVILPPVDERRFLAEDQAAESSGLDKPLRFAAPIPVNLGPDRNGTWSQLDDGSRVWRCEVISDGARSLNFGLSAFRLPPGAAFHLYPADRSRYDGPYGGADAAPTGEFWTPVVPGDNVVLELHVPSHPAFEPEVAIAQVAHDYRGFLQILAGQEESSCNNDVVCPLGDSWRQDIRSAGVYTLDGQWRCSGQLLMSLVSSNPLAYFETAYHCGISPANASTIVVYWRDEAPTCGQHCCGPLTFSQSGATFVAGWSTSDFCLIRLDQDPSPESNVYYAGWDARETSAPQTETVIHHPNCDVKAISFCSRPATLTSWAEDSGPGDGTQWRIDHYDSGTTEAGSSGAGLWDQDHRIIGQLHGGSASCAEPDSCDWYGRLALSWEGGGSPSTRLKDWLDPNQTGAQFMDGYDPYDHGSEPPEPPSANRLRLIWPNPARAAFLVSFDLVRAGIVGTEVYDAAGRRVVTGAPRYFPAGTSQFQLFARSSGGSPLASGVYFLRMTVNSRPVDSRKLIVIR